METIIELKGASKKIGDHTIVEGFDLEIAKGECFGILGPNSAGKSTVLKMLYGAYAMTEGEGYILGLNLKKNLREIKRRIGVVPQVDSFEYEFTIRELLELQGRYHSLPKMLATNRTEDVLRLMRIEEFADSNVGVVSEGIRRKVSIARGIINHPEVLIMDEPTVGLDPKARVWVWDFIKKLKAEMGAIVLTTHYLEEAEQVCDRVAIMEKGHILAIGKTKELIDQHVGKKVVEFEIPRTDVTYYSKRLGDLGFKYQIVHNQIHVHVGDEEEARKVQDFVSALKTTVRPAGLSDVFLKFAGHDFKDDVYER